MSINPLYVAASTYNALIIRVDDLTNNLTISEDGGQTFEPATAALVALLTGRSYLDPGPYDPLEDDTLRNEFILGYILNYYRPDLSNHRNFWHVVNGFVAKSQTDHLWRQTMQTADNYARWDSIVNNAIDYLDENP